MTAPRPSGARLALRSLLIQGSWNYRTLQGAGVGWALLPRGADGDSEIGEGASLFNAHPYLAPIALGALARAEADGGDRDRLRRLREALRAPLGSLGDRLVWGAWRPACLVGAIAAAGLGAAPWVAVALFLAAHNAVHLPLRVRGASVGLETGLDVAAGLRRLGLAKWAERAAWLGVLVLGVALGVALVRGAGLPSYRLPLAAGAAVGVLVGFAGGESIQRGGPILLLLLAVGGFAYGAFMGGMGGP